MKFHFILRNVCYLNTICSSVQTLEIACCIQIANLGTYEIPSVLKSFVGATTIITGKMNTIHIRREKMKRFMFMIIVSVFVIVGCNGNDTEDNDGEDNKDVDSVEDEQQEVYQIGETAVGESSSYGFPYEVTVNDFELTTDPVEGQELEDFFSETSSPSEDTRFAIVNISLENTGDEGFIMNNTFTPVLMGEMTNETPEIYAMPTFDEEILPGEELTGDLVFITDTILQEDGKVDLYFNIHDPNKEFRFELPIP